MSKHNATEGKTWSIHQDEKSRLLWYNERIVYSETDMWIKVLNEGFLMRFYPFIMLPF
ncbi:hypothetical protein [Paenibacillus sp. W2I17]|uniref:hypothetical protein n=1 Tax=Paenibacillus sp. W2I17 TaxID=3042311 RepID=UPI002782C049|nr:hypothetical protein [Paenibacillus sp. W2I17]MDQ0659144.1 hypothetical protein [Paenibacillus sp. W2I17]